MNLDKRNVLLRFRIDVNSHVTKKNGRTIFKNRRTGQLFPGKSADLVNAEKLISYHILEQAHAQGFKETIDKRLWCIFHFIFPQEKYYTKKGTISEKLPDLSNLYELPQDILQSTGVIKNDSLIDSHDGSRRLPGEAYRLDIYLCEYSVKES